MSLSKRLREAALERARLEGERVDDYVLDREGVIDLRALEEPPGVHPASRPAAALARTRGQVAEGAAVDELYNDSDPDRRWPFARRAPQEQPTSRERRPSPAAPSLPQLSSLPLSEPAPAHDIDLTETAPEIDLTRAEPTARSAAEPIAADPVGMTGHATPAPVDREARPTMMCPKCGGIGRRDLLDPVSRVEFFSCDVCVHMWQRKMDG